MPHLSGSSQGCFCLLLHLMKWLQMQRVSDCWNTSAVCRDVLQPAPTSSWEASGAQQQLQQQQQLDSDLTALLGEMQQALPAHAGRDAQEQPEAASVLQQSMTSPKQLAMVSLLHAMHLVSPQQIAVQQMHIPIPVLKDVRECRPHQGARRRHSLALAGAYSVHLSMTQAADAGGAGLRGSHAQQAAGGQAAAYLCCWQLSKPPASHSRA